jgi:hypothetical protein
MKFYHPVEPITVQMYRDEDGGLHETLKEARRANFEAALRASAEDAEDATPGNDFVDILRMFARRHPDLLRALIHEGEPENLVREQTDDKG